MAKNSPSGSVFECAARVFDGWTDPKTGLDVLRIVPRPVDTEPDSARPWRTVYHQTPCFLDGGRRVMLRQVARGGGTHCLDLTNGELTPLLPEGLHCCEVCDASGLALAIRPESDGPHLLLWDLQAAKPLSSFCLPGWNLWSGKIMRDGRRVVLSHYTGHYYDEHCVSRLHLFDDQDDSRLLFEADGFFCNHIMPHPIDPDLFAYNRWPTPQRPTDVVIHVHRLSDASEQPLPQAPATVRPGPKWGLQRDHYVWSPDGQRILSYFSPQIDFPIDDHYHFGWWVSALDWQTGEDLAAPYPSERWGCNFNVTPDSRYIVSAGGRAYQNLYAIDIEGLRNGWNEHRLCAYPPAEENGTNNGPFHMPHVLPDQSGVLFSAGWGAPDEGVFLVKWPATPF